MKAGVQHDLHAPVDLRLGHHALLNLVLHAQVDVHLQQLPREEPALFRQVLPAEPGNNRNGVAHAALRKLSGIMLV